MRINFDTDELRQRWAIMHERKDLDMFFASLMTALESERQRADHNKVMQLAAEDVSASALRDWSSEGIKLHAANEEIKRLTAEISALKGDQVPVAKSLREDILRCVDDAMAGVHDSRAAPDYAVRVAAWVTAPQKPVVLPDKKALNPNDPSPIWCASKEWNSAIDACRAAIKAAGGVVKDGE